VPLFWALVRAGEWYGSIELLGGEREGVSTTDRWDQTTEGARLEVGGRG
jgi:hypothetical protein